MRFPRFCCLVVAALGHPAALQAAGEQWVQHPDAVERAETPKGTLKQMPAWSSKIFPGTTRDWWLYVPANYRPDGSAALMVFQDGHSYIDPKGNWRAQTVLDNLIASGEMPPTVGVFINPGHDPAKGAPASKFKASNRSFEYDSLGDRYTQFLLQEILPEVSKQFPYTQDPALHAICGSSSGGICAFTVGWERPDQFRRIMTSVGSFTNIRGGNAYPSLIRKTEAKPLKVFMEDVTGDVDNENGNWPLANRQMDAALRFMHYEEKFVVAEGYEHGSKHAGSIFPDSLRWLWAGWKKP